MPRSTSTPNGAKGKGSGLSPNELAEIREWAKANGHKVADKGRIAQEVISAFNEAHSR